MKAEHVDLDIDELKQQIREAVQNRVPSTPPSPLNLPQPKVEIPTPTVSPQRSLLRRIKQKGLAIARRPKQFAARVYHFVRRKKHALAATIAATESAETPTSVQRLSSDTLTNVAILVPCLVDGDAVGNDVVGMYRSLGQHGYNPQIFAETCLSTQVQAHPVNQLKDFLIKPDDIVIYHYSIGWNTGLVAVRELQCKKMIKYHNVTPPEFYEGINEDYTAVCRDGRMQLSAIAEIDRAFYLSDSAYNAGELESLGVDPQQSWVLPPFHLIDQLEQTELDFTVFDAYQDGKFNILMVGRLAPNKGHLALIEAFGVYHNTYNPNSRLIIVGKSDPRLDAYNQALHQKVKELNLANAVVFTGGVSAAGLKSYYLVAHAFMITSEHEGFCVPLVEAMSIKLPIVAYGSTAVPCTLGKAGFVWETPDPKLLAGSLDRLATDANVRVTLGELGWQRYQTVFTNDQIESKLLELLKHLEYRE